MSLSNRAGSEPRAQPGSTHPETSLAQFARDWSVLIVAILVYFWLRALVPVNIPNAVAVTVHLIDFEKALHIFWEPRLQADSIRYDWLKEVANYTYSYLHFPALAGMGLLLWFRNRRQFVLVRNTMYVSMVIGLVFYYVIPAAPPRLMAINGHNYGFVDTVFGKKSGVLYPEPPFYVNDYAAIPSFHFGWIALASWGLWTSGPSRSVRALAIVILVSMTWASAATANHLFVDMAIGGAVLIASWAIAAYVVPVVSSRLVRLRRPLKAYPGHEPGGPPG